MRWHQRFRGPFREGTSYVRNKNHKKKDKVEDPWRVEKRFNKRRGKYRSGNCCAGPHFSRKSYVRQSAKEHRAWERRQIHNENWDALSDYSYKVFADPWYWC